MDAAINRTITLIRSLQPEDQLIVTGAGKAILGKPGAGGEVEEYLSELTVAANEAAASLFCGSILVGQSSETDEFGDVGIWLGDLEIGPGSKTLSEVIIEALSLSRWVEEVRKLEMSAETRLPVNIPAGPMMKPVGELLGRLTDRIGLTVKCGSGGPARNVGPGTVIYVIVGRLGGGAGWAGLIGVGISSDIE